MPWLPWICSVHPSRGDKGALCELAVGLAVHDILAVSWRSCDLQQSCRNLWYLRLWSKIGMCHISDQIHLLILFLTMTFAVHIVHRQAGLFPRELPQSKQLSAPCNRKPCAWKCHHPNRAGAHFPDRGKMQMNASNYMKRNPSA